MKLLPSDIHCTYERYNFALLKGQGEGSRTVSELLFTLQKGIIKAMTYSSMLDQSNTLFMDLELKLKLLKLSFSSVTLNCLRLCQSYKT